MSNMPAEQLDLFKEEQAVSTETRNVEWSFSRRSTLEQCTRRYYYMYYGANKHKAKQEPLKERLHFLKNTANRHERTGAIAHIVIRTYFQKAQQGERWDRRQLVSFARHIFQADRRFSQVYPDGTDTSGDRYPPVLLREYHYRQPDADLLCDQAEQQMVKALDTFISSEQLSPFRLAGTSVDSLIEHAFRLPVLRYVVRGSVDLAFQQQDLVTVVDWKLGDNDGSGDDSLQLATYAMWARSHFQCDPTAIRICKVHLGTGNIVDFTVSPKVLADARARVVQDLEGMIGLHEYGEDSVVEAFSPCKYPLVCSQCAFERECYA